MDIEKMIERLRTESLYADKASLEIMDLCMEAATALSTLQAENEKLREKIEDARLEGYVRGLGEMSAELEQVISERDAAIGCLKNNCPFCKKYLTCQGRAINNDCWEFFGAKED